MLSTFSVLVTKVNCCSKARFKDSTVFFLSASFWPRPLPDMVAREWDGGGARGTRGWKEGGGRGRERR
eukprot:11330352-Alexandrium_andersonii.AAC.1